MDHLAVRLQGAAFAALDTGDAELADYLRECAKREDPEEEMDSIMIRLDDIRPSFCDALIRALEEELVEAESHVGGSLSRMHQEEPDFVPSPEDWRDHVARTLTTLRTLRESLG